MNYTDEQYDTNNEEKMKNLYSGDASRNRNLQEDTNKLYMLNVILTIIYYVLLLIFVFIAFTDIRESSNRIKKALLIVVLFLYPILIFPFQYNVYYGIKKITDTIFQNIYLTKHW